MQREIVVLFTGLVKSVSLARRSIAPFIELMDAGLIKRIIAIDWDYDVAGNAAFFEEIARHGVVVEAIPYPGSDGVFNNHKIQTISLHHGLNMVENENSYVMKVRLDVVFSKEFLERILRLPLQAPTISDMEYSINVKDYRRFSGKIWIPWAELTIPFMISDDCFYGLKSDVDQLSNFEFEEYKDVFASPRAKNAPLQHIFRHVAPFMGSDLVKCYMMVCKYFINSGENRDNLHIYLCNNILYWKIIFTYYKILRMNYEILCGDASRGEMLWFPAGANTAEMYETNNLSPSITYKGVTKFSIDKERFIENFQAMAIFAHDGEWISKILDNSIDCDKLRQVTNYVNYTKIRREHVQLFRDELEAIVY